MKNDLVTVYVFQRGERGKRAAAGQASGRGSGSGPIAADIGCRECIRCAPLAGDQRNQSPALTIADPLGSEKDPILIGCRFVDIRNHDPAAAFIFI